MQQHLHSEKQSGRKKGFQYETYACQYLAKKGYQILETNYTIRGGEIDIIARQGQVLVFLEIKYRKNSQYGSPEETVTRTKQNRIRKTARFYLSSRRWSAMTPCRFDVIAMEQGHGIRHYENAFSFD